MIKAAIGIFLFIMLFLFIKELIKSNRESKEREKENAKITEKKSILKTFSRKNSELDLDERIIQEAKKLDKRTDKIEKSIGAVVDSEESKR